MRALDMRAALLSALLLVAGCTSGDRIATLGHRLASPDERVLVVAHRGCWKETAENSLAAIARCRALGIDMVELDVRRSRDGELVLMHDDTLDRMTDGKGRVGDYTLAELKRLRLRAGEGGANAPLTGERIPTFAEAMDAARGGVLVNVDAKADVYDDVLAVLRTLRLTDHVLMKSSLPAEDPSLRTAGLLQAGYFMPIIAQNRAFGPIAQAVPKYRDLKPIAYEIVFQDEAYLAAGVPAMREAGGRIWVNTLEPHHAAGHVDEDALRNPEAHWGRLMALGATIIQTDEPAALKAYLVRQGRR